MITTVAEYYDLLFDAALYNPSKLGHGREGHYFIEAGEISMYEVSKAIGAALVALGRAEEAEPTLLTPEECLKYFGSDFYTGLIFANSRPRGDRGRRDLGWKPKYTPQDLIKSIPEEVEIALKKEGSELPDYRRTPPEDFVNRK